MLGILLAIVFAALAYVITALLGLPQLVCVIVFLIVLLVSLGGGLTRPRV